MPATADLTTPREPAGRTVDAGRAMAWLGEGWRRFTAAPAIWIGMTLVLLVIFAVLTMVPILGGLAQAFLAPVFAGGLMAGCRNQAQGEPLAFAALFAGFRQGTGGLMTVGALSLAGALIIGVVVMAIGGGGALAGMLLGGGHGFGVGATLALGSMLLAALVALALMVPLMMALWFAPPLVMLGGLPPGAALRASFSGCLKNWLPFLVYGIVTFVLTIVAVIPFGLGLLVLIPVLAASVHAGYVDIYE